ncbi:hypothetical protein SFC88_15855 [Nocardioides sp. HM23]|uniref:hypothetical protein n=1 Tax=Nocardioides bizhenqiangii TaxID=3095076 RepID=UPI002AC9FC28|nr:hypothetical protein [Nocardioides sp. HM23]MDZ5622317.1 hypothetical protein [Nocardioides sp. HM23]
MSTRESQRTLTYWIVPATAVAIGIAYLVAGLVGDDTAFAVTGLLTMLAAGVVFVVAARWSETARGLLDRRDERITSIDRSATMFAGMCVIAAVLVMFVVEIARGNDGDPYSALGAVGGLAYVASLVWLRFRR